MSSELSFRNYRATDLEAMFRLDETCFAEVFRFDLASMREFAEERNGIVRVAESGCGEIVGFVILHVEYVASELRAYVVTLDVAPEHRRKGLASRLIREGEQCAFAVGVRWIRLHVFTGNTGAIHFYEQLGYERIRTRRGLYGGPGLDAFVYGKELSEA